MERLALLILVIPRNRADAVTSDFCPKFTAHFGQIQAFVLNV
jgi:hypothetical protein